MEEMADLSDSDLARRWLHIGWKIPPGLVGETVRRGGRMVPFLGRMITDRELWDAPEEETQGWAPVHALYLIQAIGDPAAAPFVEEFLREDLENTWILEEGEFLVHSLGPAAVERMWSVALDPEVESAGRAAAVDGLALLGLEHESLRADLASRFRALASTLLDQSRDADDFILDCLLRGLAGFHDEESRGLIDRACADEEIGDLITDKEDFLDLFQTPCDELLRDRLENPMDHFSPENLANLEAQSSAGDEVDLAGSMDEEEFEEEPLEEGDEAPPPIVNTSPKVGRNDPCPCGSGKKHKKCCME